jgi:ribosomal protein S18 acetylase RimI-like enzyme
VTLHTDTDLYDRGAATLLASWEEYARGAEDAALRRFGGASAAVFPQEPERSVYNNALLGRGLPPRERSDALDAIETVYAGVGLPRFAVWVHESDHAMRADLERRGYGINEYTRAMGMSLDGVRLPTAPVAPDVELASASWSDYLGFLSAFGLPEGLLIGADPVAFKVRTARVDGETVAAAISIEVDGDCGIFNVGTLEHARRQGLATALTALHVREAVERGCRTASLQSTEMGEHLYSGIGFRDLGRILEYAL